MNSLNPLSLPKYVDMVNLLKDIQSNNIEDKNTILRESLYRSTFIMMIIYFHEKLCNIIIDSYKNEITKNFVVPNFESLIRSTFDTHFMAKDFSQVILPIYGENKDNFLKKFIDKFETMQATPREYPRLPKDYFFLEPKKNTAFSIYNQLIEMRNLFAHRDDININIRTGQKETVKEQEEKGKLKNISTLIQDWNYQAFDAIAFFIEVFLETFQEITNNYSVGQGWGVGRA